MSDSARAKKAYKKYEQIVNQTLKDLPAEMRPYLINIVSNWFEVGFIEGNRSLKNLLHQLLFDSEPQHDKLNNNSNSNER